MPTPQEMRQALKAQQMRSQLKALQATQMAQEPSSQYKDEMPEWLDPNDRTVVKNLAKTPEESIKYLQGKYPDAEFQAVGDEIMARKKGEKDFGKLDPSFSPLSNPIGTAKDLWNDTKDLGYDALQGVAEGVGTAAGTALSPGLGTAAGGAAGAGAASALKEALRLKYGLSDSFDGMDVAKDAALAAVLPKTLQVAGKGLKQGAKVVPWAYSKAIGLTPEGMQVIAKRGEDIARIGKEGVTSTYEQLAGKIRDALRKQGGEIGDQLNNLTGGKVSLASARDAFNRAIEAEKSGIQNELTHERVKGLSDAADSVFNAVKKDPNKMPVILDAEGKNIYANMPDEALPSDVSVGDALKLQQQLNTEYGDFGKQAINMGQHRVGGGNSTNAAIERAAMDSSDALGKSIDAATEGASSELKGQYKRHILQTKQVAPKFKDAATIENTLKRYNKDKSQVLNELVDALDKAHGTGIQDTANLIEAHNFLNPSKQQGFRGTVDQIGGKSPIEKILTSIGLSTGYVTGGPQAAVLGGATGRGIGKAIASPKTVKAFVKAQGLTQAGEQKIMQALTDHPELLNAIYGATYAGTRK